MTRFCPGSWATTATAARKAGELVHKGMAILVAAALFASGLAVGALGVHLFYSARIVGAGGPPLPVGPMFERWLLRELDLSESQRHEVREILERSRAEADELRREMGPRLQAMNRRTTEAVYDVLTPAQRDKLDELMARQERRHGGFGGDGPPPGRRFGRRP